MADADELLNSEPELKALAETISKRNLTINISIKLIQYLTQHIDKSVLELPEAQKLMQDWLGATKSAFM